MAARFARRALLEAGRLPWFARLSFFWFFDIPRDFQFDVAADGGIVHVHDRIGRKPPSYPALCGL
jgi:hypothetical protein